MYLLDTCALIWWSLDQAKLSPSGRNVFDLVEKDGAFASSISIWEIGIKLKRGRLDIGMSIGEYLKKLSSTNMIEFLPVDLDIWMQNLALDWDHQDPADRTIVATGKVKDLKILTGDDVILDFDRNSIRVN